MPTRILVVVAMAATLILAGCSGSGSGTALESTADGPEPTAAENTTSTDPSLQASTAADDGALVVELNGAADQAVAEDADRSGDDPPDSSTSSSSATTAAAETATTAATTATTAAPTTAAPTTAAQTTKPPTTTAQATTTLTSTTLATTTAPPSATESRPDILLLERPVYGGGTFSPDSLAGKNVILWFWGAH